MRTDVSYLAAKGTFVAFTGGADGRIVKWERWQVNHFIYTSESYSCDIHEPAFVEAYDIHLVHDSRAEALLKRRVASAPADTRRQSYAQPHLPAHGASVIAKNSLTASLFADPLDVLVVGGQDHHIYIWGFDETDAFLADNDDAIRVYLSVFFISNSFQKIIFCSAYGHRDGAQICSFSLIWGFCAKEACAPRLVKKPSRCRCKPIVGTTMQKCMVYLLVGNGC
jgi:hypothetical protein